MKINLLNNNKAVFSALSPGEIFILNETDVCVKIGFGNEGNTWNFTAQDIQTVDNDTKVIVPEETKMWKMVPKFYY